MQSGKIGIFDSGFGGLSIMKEIVKKLPGYDYIYLGDTARTPYGSRSQDVIFEFTKQGVDFLFKNGAELVILACNTASSEALRKIQSEYLPQKYKGKKVLGVIIPGAEEAVLKTINKKIAVLATEATIASGAFKREIQKIDKTVRVYEVGAPLLVPLIEAGEDKSESAKLLIKQYVKVALKYKPDTLILGCTHYGILEKEIKRNADDVLIISEGHVVARKLADYLTRHVEILVKLSKQNRLEFFTTDQSENFNKLGSRFFGKKIKSNQVNL